MASKKQAYQKPNEVGRSIQTRLHPSGGQIEQEAIYVYDTRRLRGENPRDFVALALSELGTDKPANFDEGTANWFLDRIIQTQDELVDILLDKIGSMLSNLKTIADGNHGGVVPYENIQDELSTFEKNLRETGDARRQSFDL